MTKVDTLATKPPIRLLEIGLNHIKKNRLFDNIFIERTRPDSDCEFQFCVFSILSLASEKFGFSWISFGDMVSILQNVLQNTEWMCSQKNIEQILKKYLIEVLGMKLSKTDRLHIKLPYIVKLKPEIFMIKKFEELHNNCLKVFAEKFPYPQFKDNIIQSLKEKIDQLSLFQSKKYYSIKFHATKGFGKERDDIYTAILDMLEQAKKSVKFMIAYYSEDLKALARLLGLKAAEGVQVNIILRWAEDSKEENKKLIEEIFRTFNLKGSGWENFRYALYPKFEDLNMRKMRVTNLHAKMLIIDYRKLLIGSANITIPSLCRNIEVAITTTHLPTVKEAERFFEEVWNSLEINPGL